MSEAEATFAALQRRLRPFESTDDPTSAEERTVVGIPSTNLGLELLHRHATDLPALEERWLYLAFALRRPRVRVVVVTSLPVREEVLEYYLRLMPAAREARSRLHVLSVEDDSPRPLAQKILERPEFVAALRDLIGKRDGAFIMPFNVRELERDLALELEIPIYGVDHRFAAHGTKSGGRTLFAQAGVSHPFGASDVSGTRDLTDALVRLRAARPGLEAAVVKLNDAVYGEGNRMLSLRDLPPPMTPAEAAALDVRLRTLPRSFVAELAAGGGVVEEMIAGEIRSPSVQMRILPGGDPVVISTHDQVLGGDLGQTFVASRFPADPAYAAAIVGEARKVGQHLAAAGVVGRFGVDFVVARQGDGWQPYAVEINLREGGTSHPWGTLWLLTDGSLDEHGLFRTPSGQPKYYFATDTLGDRAYRRVHLADFLAASTAASLDYDPGKQTGAVYHMLGSLEDQGRIGVVAIGDSPEQAHEVYLRVVHLLDELARC